MNNQKDPQPKGFEKAKNRAKDLLHDRRKLKELLKQGEKKANKKKEKLKTVWEDFQTLLRMIKSYWKKEYTEIPVKSLLFIVASILYFVNPFDVIPDFIPMTGLLDDLTVLSFVINSVKNDIENFKLWESEKDE
ncbi:MAG: DUF1232 domain-containing protein [Vicingaceae bacterium]